MSYRKEDIPGMIKALQRARDNIVPPYGVCNALNLGAMHSNDWVHVSLVKKIISVQLQGHVWLEGWLRQRDIFVTKGDMKRLRIRWIDKMIADLREYAKE